MIQDFLQQDSERTNSMRVHALVDGLLALLAVALVVLGVDALLLAMH